MSEINFSCALANPVVRAAIRTHCAEIPWKSKLAKDIVRFYLDPKSSVGGTLIPESHLRSFLSNYCIEDEIESIVSKTTDYVSAGENVGTILEAFSQFYMTRMVTAILEDGKGDAASIVKRIGEIKIIQADPIRVEVLGDLDVQRVMEEEFGETSILPTKFDIIRRATPYKGYLRGQVMQICAAPGVGKSLFLANEAANLSKAGFEGLFIALGDMMRMDFIIRFSSIITGVDYYEVAAAPGRYFTQEVKNLLKCLRIVVLPAGQMNPFALSDFIETSVQNIKNVDYVLIDYDANFAKTTDNMYQEGDAVYNTLSGVSRPNNSAYRLVIVASQPKIMYWNEEVLPMECAADSSRKQAIIDMQLTMGRAPNTREKMGIMNIGKARRGKQGERSFYKVKSCGIIEEITKEDYALLKTYE